jgi:cytochrome P450 family 110
MEVVRLPYLNAVCSETLRITPVAMLTFPRIAQEPVELLGYPVEVGTIVLGCIYLLHQREDLYPKPKEFRPERFLERQFSPYEFMPFGGGVRRCVGDALALFEIKLVLATILSNYQLELVDSRPEYPQRRGVTLAPARGVKMRLLQTHLELSIKAELGKPTVAGDV